MLKSHARKRLIGWIDPGYSGARTLSCISVGVKGLYDDNGRGAICDEEGEVPFPTDGHPSFHMHATKAMVFVGYGTPTHHVCTADEHSPS